MLSTAARTLAGGLLAAALIATSAPSAQAATTQVELPFNTFGDIVATNTRVFVSGGQSSTSIVVTRPTGTIVGEIRGLPGPTDLQLSADRRLLYVALFDGGIAAIDTQSLQERARYDVGGACNTSLALSKSRLWFGYNCEAHQWGGNVGVIDLARPESAPRRDLLPKPGMFYGMPLIAAPAGGADLLLVGEQNLSPGSVYVYGAADDGGLTFLRENAHEAIGEGLNDLAVTRDGSKMYSASGYPYEIREFAVDDLSQPMRTFPTEAYPNAVELSPDGQLMAAGSMAWYDPDLFVFRIDGARTATTDFGEGSELFKRALAWSPTGRRLYAVTGDPSFLDQPAVLHVLNAPR